MDKLTQDLKKGRMRILEVPFPALSENQVLVKNYFSVISAGTEGRTVQDARAGYIGKAKSRQKELKQVFQSIKTNGLKDTYDIVMNKLEAPSPLGYSCAGEIIAMGKKIKDLKVGEWVACGGQGAHHSEVVSVYRNLCVPVPRNVDLRHAAFTTIGAVAIQGIRQADLRFGERCVVIGLGLLGLFTVQILRAAGIKSIGIDISNTQVEIAEQCGAELAVNRNQHNIEELIWNATTGYGADAVIIAAASKSNDPIDLAGRLCRKKGKVVVLGRVPTGFDRDTYYQKELDLRMSTSYGPGRYDPEYEEKGNDYPIGYTRWTENRNMAAFVEMLSKGCLNLDILITHTFEFELAADAYEMIVSKSERYGGILIQYDVQKKLNERIVLHQGEYPPGQVNVGLIGAGSFAQNILLPKMRKKCNFIGVATANGNKSRFVADKYGFDYCTGNEDEIFADHQINTVFILTPHNLHKELTVKALKHHKNVFVEKPLVINGEELEEIKACYEKNGGDLRLMVGFNRRFAPFIQKVMEIFPKDQPKAMCFRINPGTLSENHWMHDPELGGGRLIGDACHFIDLSIYVAGAKPSTVFAGTMRNFPALDDTASIHLSFLNGSIASISYFSNGNTSLPKEYLEIYCGGQVVIIDDFREMRIYGSKKSKIKLPKQDKGHGEEVRLFLAAIKEGLPSPIPYDDIITSSKCTLDVLESAKSSRIITY